MAFFQMFADTSETLWVVVPIKEKGAHKKWCRLDVCVMRYGGRGGDGAGFSSKLHGGPHLEPSENALFLAFFIRSNREKSGEYDGVLYFVIEQRKECQNGGKREKFPRFHKNVARFPPSKCSNCYETWCVSVSMLEITVVKISKIFIDKKKR